MKIKGRGNKQERPSNNPTTTSLIFINHSPTIEMAAINETQVKIELIDVLTENELLSYPSSEEEFHTVLTEPNFVTR